MQTTNPAGYIIHGYTGYIRITELTTNGHGSI